MTTQGKSWGPITPKFIKKEKSLEALAGAGQMDRSIAMQIKKRRGGQQFQKHSSKYISFDLPTTVLIQPTLHVMHHTQ